MFKTKKNQTHGTWGMYFLAFDLFEKDNKKIFKANICVLCEKD